jgi:hypothetical protein
MDDSVSCRHGKGIIVHSAGWTDGTVRGEWACPCGAARLVAPRARRIYMVGELSADSLWNLCAAAGKSRRRE